MKNHTLTEECVEFFLIRVFMIFSTLMKHCCVADYKQEVDACGLVLKPLSLGTGEHQCNLCILWYVLTSLILWVGFHFQSLTNDHFLI